MTNVRLGSEGDWVCAVSRRRLIPEYDAKSGMSFARAAASAFSDCSLICHVADVPEPTCDAMAMIAAATVHDSSAMAGIC
jgi:hypothetical protein